MRHALRLERHHELETVGGDILEIGGVVIRREGVLGAAIGRDLAVELARLVGIGRLEHQMLEIMRDAGLGERLVGGARLVPDHLADHGRAVVGDHHDLQPVGQRRVSGLNMAARAGGAASQAAASMARASLAKVRGTEAHIKPLPLVEGGRRSRWPARPDTRRTGGPLGTSRPVRALRKSGRCPASARCSCCGE